MENPTPYVNCSLLASHVGQVVRIIGHPLISPTTSSMIELETPDKSKVTLHFAPSIPVPDTYYLSATGMVQKDLSIQVMVCDPFGDASLDLSNLNKLILAMHRFQSPFMA